MDAVLHPKHVRGLDPCDVVRGMPVQKCCGCGLTPAADAKGTSMPRTNMSVQFRPTCVPPGENTREEHENAASVDGITHAEYGAVSSACDTSIHTSSQLCWFAWSVRQIASLAALEAPICAPVYVFVVRNSSGVRRMMGIVGDADGDEVDGAREGAREGALDGERDGWIGALDGDREGDLDGARDGARDGDFEGRCVGDFVGTAFGEMHAHTTICALAKHGTVGGLLIQSVPTDPVAPTVPDTDGEFVVQYEHVLEDVDPSPFNPVQISLEKGVTPAEMSETAAPEDHSVGQLAAICKKDVDTTGAVVGNATPAYGTTAFEIVHPFAAAIGHEYAHCTDAAMGELTGHAVVTCVLGVIAPDVYTKTVFVTMGAREGLCEGWCVGAGVVGGVGATGDGVTTVA